MHDVLRTASGNNNETPHKRAGPERGCIGSHNWDIQRVRPALRIPKMPPRLCVCLHTCMGTCLLSVSLPPSLSQLPSPPCCLHFQAGFPHVAAGWPPADQEVLAFTVLWLVMGGWGAGTSFPIIPAKIPRANLIGPAWVMCPPLSHSPRLREGALKLGSGGHIMHAGLIESYQFPLQCRSVNFCKH